ncbi:ABC transporter substrate-binding protein [Azotosporobacter soli]|uniref:ABC transporter substrate-binding protein n=1 Tax=Azotosporobacter soli TaxID=3055040 RepID=UPI0031FF407B
MSIWMKKTALLLVLFVVIGVGGCGGAKQAENKNAFAVIADDSGRQVELKQRPQRIVVLSTSLLETLYAAGGQAVGKPNSRNAPPISGTENLPEIGYVYNVNTEQILGLKPDLVIGFQGIHEKLVPLFEGSHIPVLLLKIKTYDDLKRQIALLGRIAGSETQAEAVVGAMEEQLKTVQNKLPEQGKKIVILHATAKSVTVELENSVAGNIAALLKLRNIASGSSPIETGGDMTPYSLEKLVASDPDLVLVVTMGSNTADIEKRMRQDVSDNPAWSSLRAVKDGRIVFLPSELFQLNPGLQFPEAVKYLAKEVYPEVYGNAR